MRWVTVDKAVLGRCVARSRTTYEQAAVVQKEMAVRLVDELVRATGSDRFDHVLELGCGTGLLTRELVGRCRVTDLVLNDLSAGCAATADAVRDRRPAMAVQFVPGDMERVAFPAGQDLIASSSALHWAAGPRELLARLVALLKDGGILALALFGPDNLREVSALTGRSLRYSGMEDFRAELEARCELLSVSEDRRVIKFGSAMDILRHLRRSGVNALGAKAWSPGRIRQFCREYEAEFGRDGRVPLTYHPVFAVARRRGPGGGR